MTIHVEEIPAHGPRLPLDDAEVSIQGPVNRKGVTKRGAARFDDLPPGTYRVSAAKPGYESAENIESTRELTLVPHACPSPFVRLAPTLEVGGIVRDNMGKPAPGVSLQLWEQAPLHLIQVFEARSDETGRFRFHKVKPGKFLLMTGNALRKSFFPGRAAKAEALLLDVRAGVALENLEFTLLDSGKERVIRVRVLDQVGKAVAGVAIRNMHWDGKGRQQGDLSSFDGVPRTGPDGIAVLKGFEKAHYRIDAIRGRSAGRADVAPPVDILPGAGDADTVLTLHPWRRR
jgi:hypothetical protein